MSTLSPTTAERNRQKRLLMERAVKLAMQNEWQEAIEVNREMIALTPDEPDAWNRLGKALSELGQYADARDAYQEALNRDPNNAIALKQHKRLSLLAESTPSTDAKANKLDPKLLIEETGKTGIFELAKPAAPKVLAHMAAGDQVTLVQNGSDVVIQDHRGERLGQLPPRIALRLIELMRGGNEYVAGVTSVTDHNIRVLVREIRQAPDMHGRVSFPSKGGAAAPADLRTLARDRTLQFEVEDDESFGDDMDEEADDAEGEAEETTADIEYYEDSSDDSSSRDES